MRRETQPVVDIAVETGTRKVFATALDWPGWSRSGPTVDAAIEALATYRDRFEPVARRAGLDLPVDPTFEVVEELSGGSGTDFGVPYEVAAADLEPLRDDDAARLAALVDAAWRELDAVAAVTPTALVKGPRGGGRDRDEMLRHVREADIEYARHIDVVVPRLDATTAEPVPVDEFRTMVLDALRSAREPMPAQERTRSKPWPFRYAARRFAWHALDHAWEMQDKTPST